jgi:hypothetical protein
VISVVVYGRNDNHGYNAHRRVALSLNCLAEILSDPFDEILYTDYNTPDALPTLPEALVDTLTDRCRQQLRVFRVRSALHETRYVGCDALPVVEPLARNVAVRRARPGNRWILLTNTDMVLVPRGGRALGEICASLPDAFYSIPRFELPEWLWEQLPRTDPRQAISELAVQAPSLRLDEVVTSHDWLRFDCTGDFQLVPRHDLEAVDGLDERMTLGWHVDANLGRRMLLRYGAIESLEREIQGFHCNHLRTTTRLRERGVTNDLGRFVVSVTDPGIPDQRDTWGLAATEIEEIDLGAAEARRFRQAVVAAVGTSPATGSKTDARDEKWRLEYHSGHAFAFVADALRVAPSECRVAYLGANEALYGMLADTLAALDRPNPARLGLDLARQDLGDIDLFVVDLGLDRVLLPEPLATASGSDASAARNALRTTFETFRGLVELERATIVAGRRARPIVLVNSTAVYWNAFTTAHLHCSPTTPLANVRRGTVRRAADVSTRARSAERRAEQLWRWISRLDADSDLLTVRPGRPIELSSVVDYAGFRVGWRFPDRVGLLSAGARAEIVLTLEGESQPLTELELTFDVFPKQAGPRATNRSGDQLDGVTHIDRGTLVWLLRIPSRDVQSGVVHLVLDIAGGDYRLRSLLVHARGLGRVGQRVRSLVHSSSGRTTPRH